MSVPSATLETTRRFSGWRALAAILGGFAVVFGANGALIYYALSTFSGEQEASPYEHGLAYDKDIASARAQDARGWQVTVDAERPRPEGLATVEAVMLDAGGKPLEGLAVNAVIEFPANKKLDRRATLAAASAGRYRAQVDLPAGQWSLVIEAKRDGERVFRTRNRIVLR